MCYHYYRCLIMKKKKRKIKWKNVITLLIIVFCFVELCISSLNIIKWKKDSNNTVNQVKKIEQTTEITEIEDTDEVEIIEQTENIEQSNPYWDYIKMNLINVEFQELEAINNQTKGWIQVNGTSVNYPFVQADNNTFYLTHSFDKTKNNAGWVFLDYRNDINNISKNTIIYAHGRFDKTMFGSLKNILTNGWLNDSDNYIIKLSTKKENTLWQIFSVYRIPTTSDYLKTNFSSDEEFVNFANMLLNRSNYNFDTTINKNDKILTLSTCYNDSEKLVLHAKLIKRSAR